MKKVVVTGGAGFIGSHVVDLLIDEGYEVHVIDDLSAGKKENVNEKATLHVVDMRDDKAGKIFDDAEFVFHLAANPSVQWSIDNPFESNDLNVNGTLKVLMHSADAGVKKVVFSSSCSVYGDTDGKPSNESYPRSPKSPYALHKSMNELQCLTWSRVYDLPTVCLRYFNVYGQRMSDVGDYSMVIGKFIKLAKEGKPLTVTGDGEQTRDFIHAKDVARANFLAATNESLGEGEVINIGYGTNSTIVNLAKLISDNIEYIEARFEARDSLADNSLAKKLLGWSPAISLEEGIKDLKDNS